LNNNNFKQKSFRIPWRILAPIWNKFCWPPIELFIGKVDLFHSTNYILPPQRFGKSIITIHDLFFLIAPEYASKASVKLFKDQIKKYALRANKIIVVSESTKRDVQRLLGIAPGKIAVIYEGAESGYRPLNKELALKEIKHKYKLEHRFILFVGTLEPRKNLTNLIQAYSLFRNRRKDCRHKLVICGMKGWSARDIFETAERLKLKKEIIFTGYVPENDLPLFYNAADLFTFPSLYEGFGLPVLEAMACGTPVITSNTSSLPEIVGEAAIMINPTDVGALADAIDKVLGNESLRQEMRNKGLARTKLFSWEETTKATVRLYKEVAAGKQEKD